MKPVLKDTGAVLILIFIASNRLGFTGYEMYSKHNSLCRKAYGREKTS
jgi:hypothetical protein